MISRIKAPKNFFAGVIYLVAGATFFLWAQRYNIGTATRMGPGYFPAALGLTLAAFGVAAIVQGFLAQTPNPIGSIKIEPLLLILASVVSFAFLIERTGMVVATFVCVFLACFRRALTNPLEVFLLFAALATFNYLVFALAFGMNFPIVWWE